jgi:putative MATE family efflux protein
LHDLTTGSISGHLIRMALPIMAGMVFQTAYFLVDLYFVAHIGPAALAGVAAAGNLVFLVLALTMMLGAGTLALLAHAVGRKDQVEANLVFNQANGLGAFLFAATLLGFYPLAAVYMAGIGANAATAEAGRLYMYFYIPGLAMQFIMTALSSALRATGIVQPTMLISAASLTINIVLAPVLIAGWGTGHPFGAVGAGLASSIAITAGLLMLGFYFARYEHYVSVDLVSWRPRWAVWRRLLLIGIPAGGEFVLMVVYVSILYWVIRRFGTDAQAGYGAGSRVMQAIFMPGLALSFAAAPIAGQNFGAHNWERVRATFRAAIAASTVMMVALMLLCQWRPDWLIGVFTHDSRVIAQGSLFLRIISWNFIGAGIIYSCSGIFQALGNTWPALLSSCSRFFTLALPVLLLSLRPGFRIEDVWYVSVASVVLQAMLSLLLVWREFRCRMPARQSTTARVAA